MRKEKYITEKKTGLRVKVIYRGKVVVDKSLNFLDFTTKKACMDEACRIRDEALQDIRIGRIITKEMSVDECYRKSQELRGSSLKTIDNEDKVYNVLMPDSLRIKSIEKVTTADVQNNLNDYALEHTQGQVDKAMGIWRKIYSAALMSEIPVIDRSRMIIRPRSKKIMTRRETNMTMEEFNTFCDALLNYNVGDKKCRYRNMSIWYGLQIMLYTGLRPQEAFALSRDDIDMENRTISVRKRVGSTREAIRMLIPPKTEESAATIPYPDALDQILEQCMAWSTTDPLLCDYDGLPFEIDELSHYIHRVSEKLPFNFTMYKLRHFFSTTLFSQAANPKVIQKLMRHKSANMSLYYADASEEEMRDTVNHRKLS